MEIDELRKLQLQQQQESMSDSESSEAINIFGSEYDSLKNDNNAKHSAESGGGGDQRGIKGGGGGDQRGIKGGGGGSVGFSEMTLERLQEDNAALSKENSVVSNIPFDFI